MVPLVPVAHHEGGGGERVTDQALVHHPAAGLQPGAQESIRRAAHLQALERAALRIFRPPARSAASGFSEYTCLLAASAAGSVPHVLPARWCQ